MKAELILIPFAVRGHLNAALEFAKLLVSRSHELCITVLLIKLPKDPNLAAYAESLVASFASDRIHFLDISLRADETDTGAETNPFIAADRFISSHRSRVRSQVLSRPRLAGIVLDMVCMSLADELAPPAYAFWPASAACLGVHLHVEIQTRIRSMDLEADHSLPGFGQPVPGLVFPSALFSAAAPVFLDGAKRIRESRGVVVNTSAEIEPRALQAFISGSSPPVYAVGPILHVPENGETGAVAFSESSGTIMAWLDSQPPASVLFLCFGSMGGSFGFDQLREIATALELSGTRFLWSLRQFSSGPEKSLPEGFLERTAGRGRVVGWAPQAAVLGHVAAGGFLSHCGWNSVLESLWNGVPIATWPLYAEQQLNAFQMVAELGLAVEVKMDYRFGLSEDDDVALIGADVIEAAIGKVMDGESEVRKGVKEMSDKCRNAVVPGGSSFSSLDRFISEVFENFKYI